MNNLNLAKNDIFVEIYINIYETKYYENNFIKFSN